MPDDWISFYLTAEYRTPREHNGAWLTAEHPIPSDLEVDRIWCFIGCNTGGSPIDPMDIAMDVIRQRDAFTLARFRDDHYTLPVGVGQSTQTWAYHGHYPVLRAGEIVTTASYLLGNAAAPEWVQAMLVVELIGRRVTAKP